MTQPLPPASDAPTIDPAAIALLARRRDTAPTEQERAALERLLDIAKQDAGQSRRVADFLLAWWNAGTCGAFDLTALWGLDEPITADMVTVFALVARVSTYPDALGYESDFKAVLSQWRPELIG